MERGVGPFWDFSFSHISIRHSYLFPSFPIQILWFASPEQNHLLPELLAHPMAMDSPTPLAFEVQSQAPVPWSVGCCDCFDDCKVCCLTCWCPCITVGRIAEIVDDGSTTCLTAGAIYVALLVAGTIVTTGAYYVLLLAAGYTRDFSVVVNGFSWWYSCCYRTKMRQKYFLRGNSCTDCLLHWFCEPCALCQEYREIQNRGFDMSLGWDGNVDKQRSVGVTEAPATQEGMSR